MTQPYASRWFFLLIALLASAAHSEPPRRQAGTAFPPAQYDRQFQALNRIKMPIDVEYTTRGAVRVIKGASSGTTLKISGWESLKKGDRADRLIAPLSDLLMARGTEELVVFSSEMWLGQQTITLTQAIRGIPVIEGGGLSMAIDRTTGAVSELYSYFVADHGLPHAPSIRAEKAQELAVAFVAGNRDVERSSVEALGQPRLVYYGGGAEGAEPSLVWAVRVGFVPVATAKKEVGKEVLVNAADGSIVSAAPVGVASLNRSTYTANGHQVLFNAQPSLFTLLFTEGGGSADMHAMTAYQNVGSAHTAWNVAFGLTTDNPLGIAVHWGSGGVGWFDHAGGVDWLYFEDGTSVRTAASLDADTAAHEYGHAVFRKLVAAWSFLPWDDATSINESFSDFSAVLTEASPNVFGPTVVASAWELFPQIIPGNIPQRSFSSPRSRDSLARDWYKDKWTPNEEHHKSSVMSHALYLLANGGTHARAGGAVMDGTIPSIPVPGVGFNNMKNILYAAFGSPSIRLYPDLPRLKAAMEVTANALYGVNARDSVTLAWQAVGVGHGCTQPPSAPSIYQYLNCPFRRVVLSQVPDATSYFVEYSLHGNFLNPWQGADGADTYCEIYSNVPVFARGRACNGCGCGGWSYTEMLIPWDGDCP